MRIFCRLIESREWRGERLLRLFEEEAWGGGGENYVLIYVISPSVTLGVEPVLTASRNPCSFVEIYASMYAVA
jgi:hypothetical protein